jgi:putative spermidine/putrescine transport system permease protein
MESLAARIALRAWVGLVVLFLFTPIVLILVYAFNASNIQTWPIAGFSLRWFGSAFANEEIRRRCGCR